MTIEILEPELEALIQRRIDSGKFETPGEVVAQALRLSETMPFREFPNQQQENSERGPGDGNGLDAIFAKIRGLADDIDFSRIPSTERPVDL